MIYNQKVIVLIISLLAFSLIKSQSFTFENLDTLIQLDSISKKIKINDSYLKELQFQIMDSVSTIRKKFDEKDKNNFLYISEFRKYLNISTEEQITLEVAYVPETNALIQSIKYEVLEKKKKNEFIESIIKSGYLKDEKSNNTYLFDADKLKKKVIFLSPVLVQLSERYKKQFIEIEYLKRVNNLPTRVNKENNNAIVLWYKILRAFH